MAGARPKRHSKRRKPAHLADSQENLDCSKPDEKLNQEVAPERVADGTDKRKEAKELVLGIFVGVALVFFSTFGLEPLFDKTGLSSIIWELNYETTLRPIYSSVKTDLLKKYIRVVDVSRLRDQTHTESFDLHKLEETVARIATHKPACIGIDLDFGNPTLIPSDHEKTLFIESMRRIRDGSYWSPDWSPRVNNPNPTRVPIFITSSAQKRVFLLDDVATHDSLATLPFRPGDEPGGLKLGFKTTAPPFSFSQACAESLLKELAVDHQNLGSKCRYFYFQCEGAEDHSDPDPERPPGWSTFFVNYSPINWLRTPDPNYVSRGSTGSELSGGLISVESPADVDGTSLESFADTMVFVGDTSQLYNDSVNIPLTGVSVPGIFYQACSAYTVALDPVVTFKPWWRGLLNLVVSLTIVAAFLCAEFHPNGLHTVEAKKLRRAQTCGAVFLGALFLGLLIAHLSHVLWLDFLVICLFAGAHPVLERGVSSLMSHFGLEGWLEGPVNWLEMLMKERESTKRVKT